MKVMFLCSSLQPGKDGVGDYNRRLVAELTKKNYQVVLVSCNERQLEADCEEEITEGSSTIKVYRLSGSDSWEHRMNKIQGYLDGFNPDWLSLHYVPYAFHPKGLPAKFVNSIKALRLKARTQIVFHEIWQGESSESTLKDKIIGFVQRRIAFKLIKITNAVHVTTTNDYYKNCFVKRGIKATRIPVFSNMPVGNASGQAVLNTLPAEIDDKDKYVLGVFFGGFHSHKDLAGNLKVLAANIKSQLNKQLVVTHIGRSGGIEQDMEAVKAATGLKCFVLGEWSEQDVADYLWYADVGLSNYPKVLYEKSGSIAALLNNSCPVILLKKSFEADKRVIPEIKEFDESFNLDEFLGQDKSFANKYSVAGSCELYSELFS
ncbi:glycosyltransferase family 4 protein [Flavobacterium zepuense]|uniref:Glycosyltransferase family 4 protein n=1 Tax=Flavobacterium zepuense TaxID=2593302 RepID=A0A552V2D3_9FLAO|nr:glycosyltransferase family 4 protein [Flavobacterium zepuense]TRW24630.1 glycosyltransferase family 4 protein [Flavobacterium zepuense]